MCAAFSRVLVIGCPGSGKSTFARSLGHITALPVVYLDNLFWRSDETTVSCQEFDTQLERVLKGSRWILDGNYARTLPRRLEACDRVFFLDYPVETCLEGIAVRVGTQRPDIPWIERSLDPEFFAYVRSFNREVRPSMLRQLGAAPHVPLTVFHTRAEATAYLRLLERGASHT